MLVPKILSYTTIRNKRNLMTYVVAMFFSFTFAILAASIAIFLQNRFLEYENSIFLVGLVLGLASFFAIFVDTFWSYLQNIKSARFLISLSLFGLIITVSIFLLSHNFLFFTIIAAMLYGWSYDLYDITILTTIFKGGERENHAQNIAQKKVAEAIGMIFGLMLSGFFMSIGATFTQIILLALLAAVFIFSRFFFDKKEDSDISLEFSNNYLKSWKNVFLYISHPNELGKLITDSYPKLKANILKLSKETEILIKNLPHKTEEKVLEIKESARKKLLNMIAKEGEIINSHYNSRKKTFSLKEMSMESFQIFKDFLQLFKGKNRKKNLVIWGAIAVIFFSFWDTMAVTFQPVFLQELSEKTPNIASLSGVIMASFVLPVMIFQIPFAKIADRIGREKMIFLGVLLSGISLIFLGTSEKILNIIFAGILNSLGYAMAFSSAQAFFVSEISRTNSEYPKKNPASLLRLALNLGNIFGQICGGILFAILGFSFGFLFFGIILVIYSLVSVPYLFFTLKKRRGGVNENNL